jgi:succinoglycan biosynthesis transport protein ExoP
VGTAPIVLGIDMLQSNKTRSDVDREPAAPEMLSGAESLQAFVSFVRRQFPVIVFITFLTIALGLIYVITARSSFTAEAQLMIDANKVQIFQKESILGSIPLDTAQVESQIEVLKSENIAIAVIKNLHLTEDPEFVGSGGGLLGTLFGFLLSPFGSDQDQIASEFVLNRHAILAFQDRLSVKRIGLSYVIQIDFQSYDPERAAQIANAIADAYIVDQLEAKYQATRRAGAWLQDRIKELRDQVTNAERAVVEFKTKNNIVSTGGTDKRLVSEQQVAELSSQLVIARASTADSKARLDRISSVLRADLPNASFGETVADTLKSDVVSRMRTQYLELAAREADWSARYGHDHLAVVQLRNQMREIRNNIFDELKRLGETYKSDYEIAKQREEGVQRELAQAVSKSQETDSASVSLGELQSTAQTYKTLYDNFLQRYMESVQQQSFPITESRLISTASRPLKKSNPKTLLVLAFASLGGMALGFGVGMLRDLSDRVFRTSGQVESLLGTDCIALVPLLTGDEKSHVPDNSKMNAGRSDPKTDADGENTASIIASSLFTRSSEAIRSFALVSDLHGTIKSTKSKIDAFASSLSDKGEPAVALSSSSGNARNSADPRTIMRGDNALWTVVNAPFSRFSEAIRSIKLASDLNGVVKSNRVIGLTSSLPNEGKSTVAVALAQLMSQVSARTILIDCDLRNPSLSRALAPSAKSGLLEVIAGKASLEEVIWSEPSISMAFLPVVMKFRLAHSNEILGSAPMKKLFEQLRASYDYVVVDLPPLAPIVDVHAATHLVDSFVFVIEWGRTKIDIVEHALGHAQGVSDNLLGVVLNKVDMNVFGRYASHREGYYYNKHYARYGYTE